MKRINIEYGSGDTTLFLAPYGANGSVEILDYEFDSEEIHRRCGGKQFYQSRSGASGAGYICQLADLVKVGYYRVDTVYNSWQNWEDVGEGVSVMLPYASHEANKESILRQCPVVIKAGETLIYCGFYTNMNRVLEALLSGRSVGTPKVLTKRFVNTSTKETEEVKLQFLNLFEGRYPYPWEFFTQKLKAYSVWQSGEEVLSVLHLSTLEDGTVVRTARIGEGFYATQVVEACDFASEGGWNQVADGLAYKVRENDVLLVGWQDACDAYMLKAKRLSRFVPDAKARDFMEYASRALPYQRYVSKVVKVNKLLFFLNKEKQYANVRKSMAAEVDEVGQAWLANYDS